MLETLSHLALVLLLPALLWWHIRVSRQLDDARKVLEDLKEELRMLAQRHGGL